MGLRELERTHCPQGHPYDEANTYVKPGGIGRVCRACSKESSKRWRRENPGKSAAADRAWREANREHVREYDRTPAQRARRAAAKRRLRATDPVWAEKVRARERARNQRPEIRIKRQIYFANWRASRAGAHGVEYATIEKVLARIEMFAGRCAYCGDAYDQLDHVIPLVRGGPAFPSNIVPSCAPCNRSKNWKKPSEWGVFPGLVAA